MPKACWPTSSERWHPGRWQARDMKIHVTPAGISDLRQRCEITLDNGDRFIIEPTRDGQRLEVWAPDGGPLAVLPKVANVVQLWTPPASLPERNQVQDIPTRVEES